MILVYDRFLKFDLINKNLYSDEEKLLCEKHIVFASKFLEVINNYKNKYEGKLDTGYYYQKEKIPFDTISEIAEKYKFKKS